MKRSPSGQKESLSANFRVRLWTGRTGNQKRGAPSGAASQPIVQLKLSRFLANGLICGANRVLLSCRAAFRSGLLAVASGGGPRAGCVPLRGATGRMIADPATDVTRKEWRRPTYGARASEGHHNLLALEPEKRRIPPRFRE